MHLLIKGLVLGVSIITPPPPKKKKKKKNRKEKKCFERLSERKIIEIPQRSKSDISLRR